MAQSVKNLTATPLGLHDVDGSYHVAGALGGTATLEPDTASVEIIGIYTESGSASVETLSAPANTAIPTISGTARVGQVLTASPGTWSGNPSPTFTRQWQRGTTNISGATSATYTLVAADAGQTVRVVVTATNSEGSASANSANTASVTQTPANTALPTVSGTAQVGQTLTATNGTWTGTPTPTYTRQWKADGVNISGATATTYVPVEGDVGKVITVTVTGTNSAGNASATSAGTAAVIAAA
ncbi:hypothetical protein [Rhizobium sp. LC145]|uniref:hypothetical protein n=1 Tax=Rhizobium sp. LC145 TaxID=1120688 RepID=UPI0006997BCF|nr:hypothetical protein [Rhizobium sp. LC145]TKT42795.1 hypothetical protein FDR95_28075 [Rhizobiaceae bacterium LC148]